MALASGIYRSNGEAMPYPHEIDFNSAFGGGMSPAMDSGCLSIETRVPRAILRRNATCLLVDRLWCGIRRRGRHFSVRATDSIGHVQR